MGRGSTRRSSPATPLLEGQRNTQAASLKAGDRIKLGDLDVSSSYNREKRERAFFFKVFSYEPADGPQATPRNTGSPLDAVEDGGLPDDFPA